MKNGVLVISLDFELLWGVFDKVDYREKIGYFENTRKVIPEILRLFERYDIACTWAIVGMLFNESWEEWEDNIPEILPGYENKKLCPYTYGKVIRAKETEKFCFAPDLVKLIANTRGQEIGTHTYSHYYCLEPGQGIDHFRADVSKSIEMASKFGLKLKSLVFPRNQFNEEYLGVCSDAKIRNVRTNPEAWYWRDTQKDTLAQKIFRTGDAYVGSNNKSYKKIPKIYDYVFGQKASRLLRPQSGKTMLDKKRLVRIKNEMTTAARKKEIYHLWWHPHNFGAKPRKNLEDLEQLLLHFRNLKINYGMQSSRMDQLTLNEASV